MPKLHAHFDNMYNARKTLAALKEMGFENVYVDLAGAFDYEYSSEINTGSADAPGLSALVLTSGGRLTDDDRPPLITAATAVGGMACVEDCRDVSARLSVGLDGRDAEKASEIIRKNGGRIFESFME